jgi:signal peptidase I
MRWQIKTYNHDQFRFYRGASMSGTLRPGDYLIFTPAPFENIRIGDVVVFHNVRNQVEENDDWVHRVVGIRHEGFVTRGDNNSYNDSVSLTIDNCLGKVTHAVRNGKTRSIMGGRLGFLWARCLHARHPLRNLFRRFLGRYYRWLKTSGLISCLWKPDLRKLSLKTDDGLLIKYVNNGRTVARWWPDQNRFVCRKPFDLVISSPMDNK